MRKITKILGAALIAVSMLVSLSGCSTSDSQSNESAVIEKINAAITSGKSLEAEITAAKTANGGTLTPAQITQYKAKIEELKSLRDSLQAQVNEATTQITTLNATIAALEAATATTRTVKFMFNGTLDNFDAANTPLYTCTVSINATYESIVATYNFAWLYWNANDIDGVTYVFDYELRKERAVTGFEIYLSSSNDNSIIYVNRKN